MDISVLLSSRDQLKAVLDMNLADEIIIESDSISDIGRLDIPEGIRLTAALPRVLREDGFTELLNEPKLSGLLIRGVDELGMTRGCGKEIIADYGLYSMNGMAADFLKNNGVSRITAPVELKERELKELINNNPEPELLVYGYLPMMVSAQCVGKNLSGACDRKEKLLFLSDRTGKKLPVRNICSCCYNIIYNPVPLSLFGVMDRVERLGIKRVRLDFSFETGRECTEILRKFMNRKDPESFTRGHFTRGVE